jgi:hypothetical protein
MGKTQRLSRAMCTENRRLRAARGSAGPDRVGGDPASRLGVLVVDIEAARTELVGRGVDVGKCSMTWAGFSTTPGPRDGQLARIRNVATMARLPRSVIRTATGGCSKR